MAREAISRLILARGALRSDPVIIGVRVFAHSENPKAFARLNQVGPGCDPPPTRFQYLGSAHVNTKAQRARFGDGEEGPFHRVGVIFQGVVDQLREIISACVAARLAERNLLVGYGPPA